MLTAAALCLIVGIVDGDTLTALCGQPGAYDHLKIGLAAIDAPEKTQPFGDQSRAALASLCFKQEATVRPQGQDRSGRTIADVECQDLDAGKAQVRAGMAMVDRQHATGRGYLARAEDRAKGDRLGLWGEPNPVPPWEWRKAKPER